MATQFTMNSASVPSNLEKLQSLCAVPFLQHEKTPTNWDVCGMGCCIQEGLPAATTFVTAQDMSRSKLTKLFGKAAMVRGVKKV